MWPLLSKFAIDCITHEIVPKNFFCIYRKIKEMSKYTDALEKQHFHCGRKTNTYAECGVGGHCTF